MGSNIASSKRLAKNTVILYIQLVVSIVISFWTSRLVLIALGASDYGLYNVVGGFVVMLNVFGTSMISTSYRYLAVEIGKDKKGNPNRVFNTLIVVHIIIAILLLLVGETVGLYYVDNYLNIESGRLQDAEFVLHVTLVVTSITVLALPLNGLLVAREKFFFTSLITIVSALVKLFLIFGLSNVESGRLRYYAIYIAVVQIIPPFSYYIYCLLKEYNVIKWRFNKEWGKYKEVLLFAWWILVGAIASMARVQGAAIIINSFFGTVVNAAFGLSAQVFEATNQFTNTLRQASVPQIMKSQSSGNEEHSLNLVYKVSKYSYMLMLIPSVPIIVCINGALILWLKTPPEYTNVFIILMLVNGMIMNLSAGFDAAIQATGKIRKNQIGYSIINLALLPIIYLLYSIGMPPYMNCAAMIFLTVSSIIFQSYIMKSITSFDFLKYLKHTIRPAIWVALISFIPSLFIYNLFDSSSKSVIVSMIAIAVWTMISIFIVGISTEERKAIIYIVKNKIKE